MLRMRQAALAATGICALLAGGTARADVIYSISGTAPGNVYPFGFSLDLTDAQVASGAFSLSGRGNGSVSSGIGPIWTGDLGGFVSVTQLGRGQESANPSYLYGSLSIDATFGPSDALSSINLSFQGISSGGTAIGSGAASTVNFNSDDALTCGNGNPTCSYTTAWTTTVTNPTGVPEPATFAVLGVGLLGMAGLRRQLINRSTGEA